MSADLIFRAIAVAAMRLFGWAAAATPMPISRWPSRCATGVGLHRDQTNRSAPSPVGPAVSAQGGGNRGTEMLQ
jgi:hypothetical protein